LLKLFDLEKDIKKSDTSCSIPLSFLITNQPFFSSSQLPASSFFFLFFNLKLLLQFFKMQFINSLFTSASLVALLTAGSISVFSAPIEQKAAPLARRSSGTCSGGPAMGHLAVWNYGLCSGLEMQLLT
jgi:hypothetical protein